MAGSDAENRVVEHSARNVRPAVVSSAVREDGAVSQRPKRVSPAYRIFGSQIRFHRKAARLTVEELGKLIGQAPSTVRAFESGNRPVLPPTVARLDEVLSTGGALATSAEYLAGEKVADFFADTAAVEAECLGLDSFESSVIPGLLQTEAYARAVISSRRPPLDEDEIEQRVEGRLSRQILLTRKPAAALSFIIDEWVLRRPIGGDAVFKDQLYRLLECANMRTVTLQVMPTRCVEHAGLDGPILVLEMADGQYCAYTESQGDGAVIADPERVRIFRHRYAIIRAQAKSIEKSRKLIAEIAGEL
ncbi:helix-turn-helix domain-containing protein [Embleya sp. NPDC020886]|uniref:helix-turn-helix domain-containing protein n=1 Tax=Embleya sp. NPDC020886 TaxID=3363980 RepID=UPI0037A52AE3